MSIPARVPLLLTGATGYLGGCILTRFLQRPDASSFDIRVLVRSPEKAAKIEEMNLGVTVIVGSHSNPALMEEAASQVDVVITAADSDDIGAAKSTLKGLKTRYQKTGKAPLFIHTSGAGVYADMADGKHASVEVFDDANPEQIETLAPTRIHRAVDLEIIAGDAAGYVRTYIVLPSNIWGIASGPIFDKGISKPHSMAIPMLIKSALDRGQGGFLGQGKNVWPEVEVHETAELYSVLYDAIKSGHPMAGHGREGYYHGAHEEFTWYQLAKSVSEALVAAGLGNSPDPTPFTQEELDKYFGHFAPFFGSNCRCLATRSRAIGWAPKTGLADMLASIKPEMDAIVAGNT